MYSDDVSAYQVDVADQLAADSAQDVAQQRVLAAGDYCVDAATDNPVVGTPADDAVYCHEQQYGDTCAVVAQEGVLQKQTGVDYGEDALRDEAMQNGWYTDGGGTPMNDVGNLLETHGVEVQRFPSGGDMQTLQDQLNQDNDVIVGVDAGELWQDSSAVGEGHAIWVTGVETDANGNPLAVIANDSGVPNGGGVRYDATVFQNAWAPMGNFMIATA